jgi:hypothetical protein
MASIESSSRARRRTKSLKMKTSSSSTSLVNKASKISSSSKAIEAERIITHDGFGYFPMVND